MNFIYFIIGIIAVIYIYDRYIQRNKTLLINYPIIGRFRYLLEKAREPLRQYFGDDNFFASRDKINWVYSASQNQPKNMSFSPSDNIEEKFAFKHNQIVLNDTDISNDFSVEFGNKYKYKTNSLIGRSEMRDGSISPEATKAFSIGALKGKYPINTGEGGLTSNFLSTMKINGSEKYLTIIDGSNFSKSIFFIFKKIINKNFSAKIYRYINLKNRKDSDSFLLDIDTLYMYRINWDVSLDKFPESIPENIPDIILQIGVGKYSVRKKDGTFDFERYEKVMRFCQMTEIKIAQGAKQIGGSLSKDNIDSSYAYYYNVNEGEDVKNRYTLFKSEDELLSLIDKLREISKKPIGIKIVISNKEDIENFIKKMIKMNIFPDFITIDGGEGGSTNAPLDLVNLIGLDIQTSIHILKEILKKT